MSPQDPELAKLLNEFVPVRITNFKGVDMNRFRFDYDLTFAALMMNADGYTYARYGSQDWRHGTDRMSIPGLKHAMRAVLATYRGEPAPPKPAVLPKRTLAEIPAFASSKMAKSECYHCHFANNGRFLDLRRMARFTKDLLYQYPLPENVGLTLNVDTNTRIDAVAPGSPADKAGIRAGDTLLRAGSARVYSQADLQFVLDPIPDDGAVSLQVERAGQALPPVMLRLPHGWRKTDISWRPSQDGVAPQVGIWGEPLDAGAKKNLGIGADRLALKATFFFPGPEWAKTRGDLKMGDVIVAVDGRELPEMTPRQFHSYVRMNHEVGDTLKLDVLRGGQRVTLALPCMEVQGE